MSSRNEKLRVDAAEDQAVKALAFWHVVDDEIVGAHTRAILVSHGQAEFHLNFAALFHPAIVTICCSRGPLYFQTAALEIFSEGKHPLKIWAHSRP